MNLIKEIHNTKVIVNQLDIYHIYIRFRCERCGAFHVLTLSEYADRYGMVVCHRCVESGYDYCDMTPYKMEIHNVK